MLGSLNTTHWQFSQAHNRGLIPCGARALPSAMVVYPLVCSTLARLAADLGTRPAYPGYPML